jgi:hypothetical protein
MRASTSALPLTKHTHGHNTRNAQLIATHIDPAGAIAVTHSPSSDTARTFLLAHANTRPDLCMC